MCPDMTTRDGNFKQAIRSYRFPKLEPIFCIDLNGRPDDPGYPHDPCLFVFRPAGPEAEWHRTIEAFWASALFNFLEDCGDDHRFEELGEAGEYRPLSDDEAHRILGDLIGEASSDYITLPVNPTSCFLVYHDADLKALVGTDSAGFFAVIWKSWGAETAK